MHLHHNIIIVIGAFLLMVLTPYQLVRAGQANIDSLFSVSETGSAEQRIEAFLALLEWDDLSDHERRIISRQLLSEGKKAPYHKPGWPFLANAKTAYYFEITDSVFYFINKALPIFLATNDIDGLFESYILGERHAIITGDSIAEMYHRKASTELWIKNLSENQTQPDSIYIAELYINTAHKAFVNLDYEGAFKGYEAAAGVFKRASELNRYFDTRLLMARSCLPMARHEKALEILNELISETPGMPQNKLANVYFFMAQVYNAFMEFDRVSDLLDRAVSIYKQTGNNISLAQTYVLIGNSYSRQGNLVESSAYFQKAIDMMKESPYSTSRAVPMANLGSSYMRSGKLDLAKPYFDTAVVILKKHGMNATLSQVYMVLADYAMLQNNPNRASQYYDSAYHIIQKSKAGLMLRNFFSSYSNHLKNIGDYQNALYYHERLMKVNDSLNKVELKKQFEELMIKHDTERVRFENSLLEAMLEQSKLEMLRHKTQKRLAWLIVLFSFVLVLLLLLLFRVYLRNVNYKRRLHNEKLQLLHKEKLLVEKEHEAMSVTLQMRNKLLKTTNNQLLQYAMFTKKLIDWIKELKPFVNKEGMSRIQNNLAEAANYSIEQSWSVFENNFQIIYPGFTEKIRQLWPELTTSESRLICFIIMRLHNDEISLITSQSISSLRSARFRIRQKFEVNSNEELIDLIAEKTGYQIANTTTQQTHVQDDLPSVSSN